MCSIEVFGRSHEEYIGAELRGLPAGEYIDMALLRQFMERRRPLTRSESDEITFVSGLNGGETDGKPLRVLIRNEDVRSSDYEELLNIPRPGHADYPAMVRWGGTEDLRGGGKFSGRMTAPVCAVGAVAVQILRHRGVELHAEVAELHGCSDASEYPERIRQAAASGDSLGGTVVCKVTGLPVGIGDALFDGLDGAIAYYVFGIPGCKGVSFGEGFGAARLTGAENNDGYRYVDGTVTLTTNHAGGVLGGMSNGAPLVFQSAFKPTPSIGKTQQSVNLKTGENVELNIHGRHDTAYVLRVPPVVEAVTAIALLSRMELGPSRTLEGVRRKIDAVDEEIARLLKTRFELTDPLFHLKDTVRDESREQEVLSHVRTVAGDSAAEAAEEIYRDIMAISRRRQTKGENGWSTD